MIKYSVLVNDNGAIKILHTHFYKLKTKQQVQDYLDKKYDKVRYAKTNLYGVEVDDYELEKPELVGVLSGWVKEKKLQ